jgi:hypothetical protein
MINEYNEEHVWTVLCLEQSRMFFLAFLVCFFSVFVFFACLAVAFGLKGGGSLWERGERPWGLGQHCSTVTAQFVKQHDAYQDLPRRIEDAAVQYATVTIRLSNSVRPALDLLMWDFNRLAIWIDDVWYSNVTVESWNFCILKRRRCRRLCVQRAR